MGKLRGITIKDGAMYMRAMGAIARGMSPVVAPSATTPDERPGDYLPDSAYSLSKPHVTRDRYPAPATADLVIMWRKDGRAVLSVTSAGVVQDFYVAPNVVGHLARSGVELLEHSTNLRG